MHHDESEHAWFAWRLVTGQGYHYDPVFHGPVQFYLIALADLLLGAGDTVVRIPPVADGHDHGVPPVLPAEPARSRGGVDAPRSCSASARAT